jgi:hypothetical protein
MPKKISVEIDDIGPAEAIALLNEALTRVPEPHRSDARVTTDRNVISFVWSEPADPKMRLSDHFTLTEFIKSVTAVRNGIDNTPPEDAVNALRELCINVLEPLRAHLGRAIKINSGYRSPALNALVNGSKTSSHLLGQAADIEVDGVSNFEIYDIIKRNLAFDQLILEFHDPKVPDSGWVHVSWRSRTKNRNSALEIK